MSKILVKIPVPMLDFLLALWAGLFPGKLAATTFNSKIELFEKAAGLFKCQRHKNAARGLRGTVSPPAGPGQSPGGG